MNWIRSHKLEVAIFLCALAARLVLFSVNFSHNGHDLVATIHGDDGYYEISQNLLQGNGFSFDTHAPYNPNPLRPPVWPFLIAFIAKIFGSYWAVFAFEIILGSLIPVLGMKVAEKVFGRKVGKWTGLIMAFEPYLMLFSFILYSETCFMFFFLISLIFLFRYSAAPSLRNAAWTAAFLGLATLVKPTVEFLPFLLPLIFLFIWRKSLSKARLTELLLFLLIFSALLVPWLYRNHQEFGVWGISAQPAFNLYVYLVPSVLAIDNGTDFKTEYQAFVKKDGFDENAITLANAARYKSEALAVLKEHKIALVKSGLLTLVTFFTHDGLLTVFGYSGITFPDSVSKPAVYLLAHPKDLLLTLAHYARTPAALILVMRVLWVLTTVFFVIGAYFFFKREEKKALGIISLALVLYFAATTAVNGLGVNARFRMPVDAFILGFALYGLSAIKDKFSQKPDQETE